MPSPRAASRRSLLLAALAAACGGGSATAPADPPVIVQGPAPRVVPVGTAWEFAVVATGSDLRYQWRRDGRDIAGATAPRYAFRPSSPTEAGVLDVVVRNAAGAATSDTVRVRVVTADGPWTRDLRIAAGADPSRFGAASVWVRQAGVPSLARLPDGRLIGVFQWFPFDDVAAFDRVAVVFSSDTGRTWSAPTPVRVTGFPATLQRPFDPTVTVTPTGQVRLYFTSGETQGGAPGPLGFYSAISADGVTYAFEPGVRFQPGRSTVDCAVLRWNGRWHLLSPVGAPAEGAYHAVSDDGLAFTRLTDVPGSGQASWIGNLAAVGAELRFYGGGPQGVWYSATTDGARWGAPVTVTGGAAGGDPAVVEAAPGRWVLVVTG